MSLSPGYWQAKALGAKRDQAIHNRAAVEAEHERIVAQRAADARTRAATEAERQRAAKAAATTVNGVTVPAYRGANPEPWEAQVLDRAKNRATFYSRFLHAGTDI